MEFETAIERRAAACGLVLPSDRVAALAGHARAVLEENRLLHLTSVTDPPAFVERHLGESLEGAALLEPEISGTLIDLGSGNGYPGLPIAAARSGLHPVLVESSHKKAAFLREVLDRHPFPGGDVVEGQVQRSADLEGIGPVRVLATRAMGAWAKIVPRLVRVLRDDAVVLLWAGADAEAILRREAWKTRLTLERRHPLPGRDRSWVWLLRPV
jgi:16S rRNA (guanine527-N7)-methyltransferase